MRCGVGCISVPGVNFVCTVIIGLTLVWGGGLVQAAPPAGGSDSSKAAPSRPPIPQEIDAAAKAEKERLANIAKAKAAAIPFLKMIVEKYPKSPRCEESAYKIAVLQYDLAASGIDATGKPIPPEKLDQAWKDVAASLAKFCETYPKSQFAGDAYVRNIDIALEQQFDLPVGKAISASAVAWAKGVVPVDASKAQPMSAWQSAGVSITDEQLKFSIYDVYLRATIVAYLGDEIDQAAAMLTAAGPVRPSEGKTNVKKEAVGLYYVQKAFNAKLPIGDQDALAAAKTDKQKTALKLADFYIKALRYDKAMMIYERLRDNDPALAPVPLALETYCLVQAARTYSVDGKKHSYSLDSLMHLYDPKYAKEPAAVTGILMLGALTFGDTQDPKKSMPHYEYVFKNFPDHPQAERAMYFYTLDAVDLKDKALAEQACNAFLKKYPKSIWKPAVEKLLAEKVPQLKANGKDK